MSIVYCIVSTKRIKKSVHIFLRPQMTLGMVCGRTKCLKIATTQFKLKNVGNLKKRKICWTFLSLKFTKKILA